MAFTPSISASAVAALIGKNPYRPPYEVMYDILRKDRTIEDHINQLQNTHQRVSLNMVRRVVSSSADVRQIVKMGIAETETDENIPAIVDRAAEGIHTLAVQKFPTMPDHVRRAIVNECASDIQKQRGTRNENAVLNEYEAATNTVVTERNTCMRYAAYDTFKLCGRIDGYVASLNRIVDSKERTRQWASVPKYDEIQLRVYMELMKCPEAELVERFPNKTTRTTLFKRDDESWKEIYDGLVSASAEMSEAAQNDVILMKIIDANTFKDETRRIL